MAALTDFSMDFSIDGNALHFDIAHGDGPLSLHRLP